jgi:Tol biopolymer transport system component
LPKAGEPTWSPDNDRIAFTVWGDKYRYPENRGDLVYVARRDGLSPEPILPGIYDGDLGQPDWSPDGKRIAAAFRRGGGASHLYIIELDEYLQP